MSCYLYILEGKDGYLYTGITRNIRKRTREHNLGLSRVTKSKRPLKLLYYEKYENKFSAAKREKEIKGWTREKKIKLALSASEMSL
jgi:putative endonuclease